MAKTTKGARRRAEKPAAAAPAAPAISLADFRRIPAFSGMNEEDARVFLSHMTGRPAARGEPILKEGERGEGLYVILQGRVTISKLNAKGGDRDVAVLERHEVLGEMDLISDRPHTVGARARESSLLLFLPRGAFQRLLVERNPGAIMVVIYCARMLAGRLDSQNRQMMDVIDGAKKPASSEFSEFKRRLLKDWTF